MTKLVKEGHDQFGDSHNWEHGEPHQWGTWGGRAQTRWACLDCGVSFIHFYHDIPDIRQAMRQANIPDQCTGVPNE